MIDYTKKYIKYKNKYLSLKKNKCLSSGTNSHFLFGEFKLDDIKKDYSGCDPKNSPMGKNSPTEKNSPMGKKSPTGKKSPM